MDALWEGRAFYGVRLVPAIARGARRLFANLLSAKQRDYFPGGRSTVVQPDTVPAAITWCFSKGKLKVFARPI